ncbi:hypothetical protein A6769_20015 [Nostoc punctiforme NIES-2108]|uniref:Uncharacterized protein n=1 Tax=Nostoc punctiforme NIES-2108 TaxID=1356359 RepID=A0A367RF35_NOSPU|nr:hypothetical protein A6769_20015 [Nostoc punctiforme NIES-2108]
MCFDVRSQDKVVIIFGADINLTPNAINEIQKSKYIKLKQRIDFGKFESFDFSPSFIFLL